MSRERSPPFTTRVLDYDYDSHKVHRFETLLPASIRMKEEDSEESYVVWRRVAVPTNIHHFLERDLLLPRTSRIHSSLYECGQPSSPLRLGGYLLSGLQPLTTEDAENHLVYDRSLKQIMIKPLPRYLLEPEFWTNYLLGGLPSKHPDLEGCARGLLYSYCALVGYKSDFRIARNHGFIPEEVTWDKWRVFVSEYLENQIDYGLLNPRYWYGALEASKKRAAEGLHWDASSFVKPTTFYSLGVITGYIIVALAAFQVGLGMSELSENRSFQTAAHGFVIFCLVAPLAVFVLMILCIWFKTQVAGVVMLEDERVVLRHIGVEPSWRMLRPASEYTSKTPVHILYFLGSALSQRLRRVEAWLGRRGT